MKSNRKNKKYLYEDMKLRYDKSIYFPSSFTVTRHFLFSVNRCILNCTKSLIWLLKNNTSLESHDIIGVFATRNQLKALSDFNIPLVHISSLSWTVKFCFLVASFMRLFCLPMLYLLPDRRSNFELAFVGLELLSYKLLVEKLRKENIRKIYISNDHAGAIYYFSLMLRQADITVSFVQHGDLKVNFPKNYFDELWLRDEVSKQIAQQLCLNKNAKFYTIQREAIEVKEKIHTIILLSHPFKIIALRKLRLYLKNEYASVDVPIVRLHPSTRFLFLKVQLLRLLDFDISLCHDLETDLKRAKYCIGAMSSALREAVDLKARGEVFWCKELGFDWDYYDLKDRLEILKI